MRRSSEHWANSRATSRRHRFHEPTCGWLGEVYGLCTDGSSTDHRDFPLQGEQGIWREIKYSIFRFSGWRCRRPGLQENETKTRLPPKGDPEHSIAARRLHPHNVLHPIFVCGDNAARPISSQKEAVSGKMANSKIAELYKHHCPLVNPEKDRTIELLACGLPVWQSFRHPRSVR